MASAIAAITIDLSIAFSRATASAICKSSSLFALTAIFLVSSRGGPRPISIGLFGVFGFDVLVGSRFGAAPLLAFLPDPLVLPERLTDQVFGEHQPRLGDRLERHACVRLLAFCGLLALDQHCVVAQLGDLAAEALAVVDQDRRLDLDEMADACR